MPFSSSKLPSNRFDIQSKKQRLLLLNTSMGQNASVKRTANDIQAFLDKEKEKFIEKYESPMRQNAQLDDFELIRTIGTGSFGKRKKSFKSKFLSYFVFSRTSTFSYTSN
jgi:hypothetical protein